MNKTSDRDAMKSRYPRNFPIPPDRMEENKLQLILERELSEWKVVRSTLPENPFVEREELYREYVFKDFDQVLEYMTRVARICNTLPHHPRWENTWNSLKVYLTTWDSVHIITYKDIMLARHMEKIYREYGQTYVNASADIRNASSLKAFMHEINELKDKGNLELAFNKLSQYISQPGEVRQGEMIQSAVNEFNDFIQAMRTQPMSDEAINTRTLDFKRKLEGIIQFFQFKPKVFFSYAWGGEKEKIVDELYQSLVAENAYEVIRDKVNLGYNSLISAFMKEIGKGSFVIVALSDKYLRSENCMFELYELYRNSSLDKSELLKKIFPIRVESLALQQVEVQKQYYTYWKELEEKWKELVNEFGADQQKYRIIQAIRFSLTDLLPFLNDINAMTDEVITRDDFAEIKKAIRERVIRNAM